MRIAYNETTPSLRRIPIYLYDTSRQPIAGAVPAGAQIQVSKSGAAWVDAAGIWTENSGGVYYYQATQSETATDSFLWIKVLFPGAHPVQFPVNIGDRVDIVEPVAAARRFPIYLTDISDAPLSSLNLVGASQLQVGKNGAAFVDATGTVAEIGGVGNGQGGYYYEATAAEIDTLGYDVLKVFPTGLPNTRYVYTFNVVTPEIIPPASSSITLAIIEPPEGSVINRLTPLQFTVTGTAPFRRVWISVQLGGSTVEETIHDGISFAPIYTGGVNSRSNVTIGLETGYQFNVLRLGGWRGSSATIKIIAIDTNGVLGVKTIGNPIALYTWQIVGGGSGDVTPFVGQGGV